MVPPEVFSSNDPFSQGEENTLGPLAEAQLLKIEPTLEASEAENFPLPVDGLQILEAPWSQDVRKVNSAAIRVLHVINGEHYAGAERVQDLLALRLPEFGVEVGFAVVKPGLFGRRRWSQQTPLYETPMRGRFDLRPAWRLARIIRQENYALIHAHTPRTLLVGALAAWLTRRPLVYHVHSPAWADSTRWFFNWANATLERLAAGRATHLICVSQTLAQQMHGRGVPESKITVVPNGVPMATSHWQPKILPVRPEGAFRSAAAEEANPAGWTVGIVALFRPRKGIEVLLEALALLDRQDIPVRLRAVGPFESPSYEATIRQKVLQLGLAGRVDWTGPVGNVEAELAQMDLFVLPSLFGEGMPMVLLEAMAVGVPIVASRIPGIEEVIHDGQEGFLSPPGNPQALAQAMAHLLTHPVQAVQLSQNARKRHRERYSDRAMAAGAAEVYRRILADRLPDGSAAPSRRT